MIPINAFTGRPACDAFIASATYKGREMTDTELDRLNEDSDFVYQAVLDRLY